MRMIVAIYALYAWGDYFVGTHMHMYARLRVRIAGSKPSDVETRM
jgi:hypothetical protein